MKLFLKTVFLMAMLLLLVMTCLKNRSAVTFNLPFSRPPIVPQSISQPAAIMYFGLFALGVITGSVLFSGSGGAKDKDAPAGKPAKSKMIR